MDPFPPAFSPQDMGFTGAPLDRADAIRQDKGKLAALTEDPSSRFLLFHDLKPLMADGALAWVSWAETPPEAGRVFLGLDAQGAAHFAAAVEAPHASGRHVDARSAAMQLSAAQSAIVGQGRSLLAWHERHPYCAVCGAPSRKYKGGYARRCTRESCAAEHFPRVDPVTIMLVIAGDDCLLGRQPQFPKDFYSALAGFVEPGESLEEAVRREVQEEAGVPVGQVRYVASQPWPFPSSLMIGCFAEALDRRITLDETELEDARWFSRAECAAAMQGGGPFQVPPKLAIAHHLLAAWLCG